MNLVILESPYAAPTGIGIARNIVYARRCLRDSLLRGEAPLASHLLYTQRGVLDDKLPDERARGIAAGLAWVDHADIHIFYTDLGWSSGMLTALDYNLNKDQGLFPPFRLRALDGDIKLPPLDDPRFNPHIARIANAASH